MSATPRGSVRCFSLVLLLLAPLPLCANAEVLGPLDGGAEQGSTPTSYWFTGASGGGFVDTHDSSDPYTGSYDFKVGNTVVSTPFTGGNYGDFRSLAFTLGSAAGGNQPIAWSFAFRFPGLVNAGDNLLAELIFYEGYGTNGNGDVYVGEYAVSLGSSSGDSSMSTYELFTHDGIIAPATAAYASVRFTANIFLSWSSGAAFFDDIVVTTAPASVPEIDPASAVSVLSLCAAVFGLVERRGRPAARRRGPE